MVKDLLLLLPMFLMIVFGSHQAMEFFLTLILFNLCISSRYKIISLSKDELAKKGVKLVN